jgi:hypothetical protein
MSAHLSRLQCSARVAPFERDARLRMPVFTVMAENPEGVAFKLHNEAVRVAADAIATVERFQQKGFRNIRIYRETDEINENDLRAAAATERANGALR